MALCPSCGYEAVTFSVQRTKFPYGMVGEQVILETIVPVGQCGHCEFVFTDERAEKAKQVAVDDHLRKLGKKSP